MKNYMKSKGLFFFFSLHTIVLFSMELEVFPDSFKLNQHDSHTVLYKEHMDSFKADKIIPIFDSKKTSDKGFVVTNRPLWREELPGEIMIATDDEGVIMSHYGEVKYCSFDTLAKGGKPETIICHDKRVKHFPMLATMCHKGMFIVSAGNYSNNQDSSLSEYILFRKGGWCKNVKLPWCIHSIALDSVGKMLAIAGASGKQNFVEVFDLDEVYKKGKTYCKQRITEHNWVKDIVINSTGDAILVTESQNGIEWMKLKKDKDKSLFTVDNYKRIVSKDNIKKVYYPYEAEFLYVTDDGHAKTMKVVDLIAPNNEDMDTTKITNFSHFPSLPEVTADPCARIVTAHWSKDPDSKIIKVCYGKGECTEVFTLEMPVLNTHYDYLADSGKYEVGITHLLHVALRGNRIVAFTTNGAMIVWSLLQQQPIVSHELEQDQLASEKIVHSDPELFTHSKEKRGRTGSSTFLRLGSLGRMASREGSPKSPRNKSDSKEHSPKSEIKLGMKTTKSNTNSQEDNII